MALGEFSRRGDRDFSCGVFGFCDEWAVATARVEDGADCISTTNALGNNRRTRGPLQCARLELASLKLGLPMEVSNSCSTAAERGEVSSRIPV